MHEVATFHPDCKYIFSKDKCTSDKAIKGLPGMDDFKWIDICNGKQVTPLSLVIGRIVINNYVYHVHIDWCEEVIPKEL